MTGNFREVRGLFAAVTSRQRTEEREDIAPRHLGRESQAEKWQQLESAVLWF